MEDAEGEEVGAGGEDKSVWKTAPWQEDEEETNSGDMTQDESKIRTLFHLSQMKCAKHALWCMYEKSVSACIWVGMMSTNLLSEAFLLFCRALQGTVLRTSAEIQLTPTA